MRLDDDVHQNLKLKTIQDGKSIQSLVKEFVDIYLNSGKTATELLNELKK